MVCDFPKITRPNNDHSRTISQAFHLIVKGDFGCTSSHPTSGSNPKALVLNPDRGHGVINK